MRGYQPLLAACVEIGLFVNSRFQHGNANTQGDLVTFIEECRKLMPARIKTVRSDSAGYNHQVVNHCFKEHLNFTITADHIPEEQKDANAVIHFHEKRGEMERMIGELKSHYNMDHFPCGQFSANSLYFAIGIFAFNLVQLLKQHYFGKDRRTKMH